MWNPANLIALIALALIVFTVIKTRRRVKRIENKPFQSSEEMRQSYEKKRQEDNSVKLVELCREIEARIQNKALAIEKLICDADAKIKELDEKLALYEQKSNGQKTGEEIKQTPKVTTNPIVEEVIKLSREGKSDKDIGDIIKRSEGEVSLMRSLGLHAEKSN